MPFDLKLRPNKVEAIKELRCRLPEHVNRQLVEHGEEGTTDDILCRWLTGRKWNVSVTAKDLAEHAEWRARCVPGRRVQDDVVAADLARDMVYLMGYDRRNHPTLLLIGGNFVPQDPEQTTLFVTYTLDAVLHLGKLEMARKQDEALQKGAKVESWDGRLVVIFDLSQFGWSNIDYGCQKAILRLLQKHYVERLYRMYIYCAPSIFAGLYQVLSLLLEPDSREKIMFIDKANAAAKMKPDFDTGALIPAFGGTLTNPRRIDDVWREVEACNPDLNV